MVKYCVMSFCCWWWWSDCIVLRCFVCITTVYAPEKIPNVMTIIFHLTSHFKTLLCWLQNARFDSEWHQAILNQTEHSVVNTSTTEIYINIIFIITISICKSSSPWPCTPLSTGLCRTPFLAQQTFVVSVFPVPAGPAGAPPNLRWRAPVSVR